MEKKKILYCCVGVIVILAAILLIFGSSQTLNDEGQYVGDDYIKMFLNVADDDEHYESEGLLVIDLVTDKVIKNSYDDDLINETVLVNVTNMDTNKTENHNLTYNEWGQTALTYIGLPYGNYHVSAYFPGNIKYKSCHAEANITIDDDSTLNSSYTGDYEWVSAGFQ